MLCVHTRNAYYDYLFPTIKLSYFKKCFCSLCSVSLKNTDHNGKFRPPGSDLNATPVVIGVVNSVIIVALILTGAFLYYKCMRVQISGGGSRSGGGMDNPVYNSGI